MKTIFCLNHKDLIHALLDGFKGALSVAAALATLAIQNPTVLDVVPGHGIILALLPLLVSLVARFVAPSIKS